MEISTSWQERWLYTLHKHGDGLLKLFMLDLLPCYKANLNFMFTFVFITDFFFNRNRICPCFFTKSTYLPLLNYSVNHSNIGTGNYTQVIRAIWMKKPRLPFCFTHKCGVTSSGVCHPRSAVGLFGNPTGTLTPLQGNPWSSPTVRCSHSFHRRWCSISQSGSKMRGLCYMEEAKTPKCGKLQKQTPVPGIALLKPARWGPCKIKDQSDTETVFPEDSTISTAYNKYFHYNVFNF